MGLYLKGTLVIHSNPYYLNRFSNLGNLVIPVVVNLLSRYKLHLILPLASLLKPLLYVACIPGYLHNLMMDTKKGMMASGGFCTSIGGTLIFSIKPLELSKLSFSELDSTSSSSSEGGGECGGRYSGSLFLVLMEVCPLR